jgi:hypothetical protein
MEFRTLMGLPPEVDEELNALISEGWNLHTFQYAGTVMYDDESEHPVFAYLLMREKEVEEVEVKVPRKVIGRH